MAYVKPINKKPYQAYTEEFVKSVLEKTNIVELISKYTKLENKSEGRAYVGDCPFHENESKSLIVYTDSQSFHCFDCGEGGNAIDFIAKKHNLSFNKAVEHLAKMHGMNIEQDGITQKPNNVLKHNLYNVYADAAKFYQMKLSAQEGADARAYIEKRKLTEDTVKTFRLGYAPTKGNALYKYLLAKGYSEDLMLQAGLIKMSENGAYDMFRGRLMFPIIDAKQRVIAFGGRVLDDEAKPKYLNSPESPIFNKSSTLYGIHDVENKHHKFMILCEGNVDVIALHQAGIKGAVATLGTAFTSTHIPVISRYTDRLILSFDGDMAGQKAAHRTIKTLSATDMKVRVLSMSPSKDPDDFLKQFGVKEYYDRIRRSVDKVDFQLKYMATQFDLSDPEQKQAYLTQAVEMIMDAQNREQSKEPERDTRN